MFLGFKTELKLNKSQQVLLSKLTGTARHAGNWGLGLSKQILNHTQANPEEKIKFSTVTDLGLMPKYVAVSRTANRGFISLLIPIEPTVTKKK